MKHFTSQDACEGLNDYYYNTYQPMISFITARISHAAKYKGNSYVDIDSYVGRDYHNLIPERFWESAPLLKPYYTSLGFFYECHYDKNDCNEGNNYVYISWDYASQNKTKGVN